MNSRDRSSEFRTRVLRLAVLLSLSGITVAGEEKKIATALLVSPLAVATGQTVKFDVRGLNLSEATAVRIVRDDKTILASIKSKGAAAPPTEFDAKEIGDTHVECEVSLPTDFPAGTATVTIVTPAGEAKQSLLVTRPDDLLIEKEPNDGYRQAQPLKIDQTAVGSIGQAKDVDVYQIVALAGQKLEATVGASQHGSALDAILTVFDADGQIVAQQDDDGTNRDPRLTFVASAGKLFVVIQDAHDRGGLHPYLLTVRVAK